jgi:raffinose/stachyose/melibiose transport system substrate-binding protein
MIIIFFGGMMKKFLLMALVALIAVGGVFAGGASQGGKTTIRFATQSIRDGEQLEVVLQQFQKDYPNVTLEIEEYPGNDLIQAITTAIQGNNCPDVFTYWRPEVKWDFDKFTSVGAIADLTELKNDAYYQGMFPDYAWRTATLNGKVVGIPRQNFYTAFLINKEIFQKEGIEPPTDWAKTVAAAEKLAQKGYIVWATDTAEKLDDASRVFNAAIEAHLGNDRGISLMTGKERWTQPDVVEALNYFLQIVKKGYAPEDSSALDGNTVISKYLVTGRAGMIIQNASQVWPNIPYADRTKFEAYPIPLTPTSKNPDKVFNELDLTNLLYVSSKAWADPAKKPLVTELIKRLTSRETAKLSAENDGLIVPNFGVTPDASKVAAVQTKAADIAYNAKGYKWMLSQTASNVVDDFRLTINAVFFGEITDAQTLAQRLDQNLYGKQ